MNFQNNSYLSIGIYSFILGPAFSTLYFYSLKEKFKYFKLIFALPIILILGFCSLIYFYTLPARWIWLAYLVITIISSIHNLISHKFVLTQFAVEKKKRGYSFSSGMLWSMGLSGVFFGISWIPSIVNYWIFSPYVPMDPMPGQVISVRWLFLAQAIGFVYGFAKLNFLELKNIKYGQLILFTLMYMFLSDICILLMFDYPLHKLFSLTYGFSNVNPMISLVGMSMVPVFYWFLLTLYPLSLSSKRRIQLTVTMIPILLVHLTLIGNYWNTMTVTMAYVQESSGNIEQAKKLYMKVIPDLDNSSFVASLKHRLGVLNLIEGNVKESVSYFQKVVTDYKKSDKVFKKAKKYMASYNKNVKNKKSVILQNNYQTFEQAASCFPNSLGYILSYYDKQQIDTRELSFSIKESFFAGTFIWKAESYLKKRGYSLINSYWQDGKQLRKLLDAGFPVLIYVPGHVYTVYGYNEDFELFYTYDTAKQNRWDDKPFDDMYDEWSKSSFLMSVVIKTEDENKLKELLKDLLDYSDVYSLYQKSERSDYYFDSKSNFYRDYNKSTFGLQLGAKGLLSQYPIYRLSADQIAMDSDFFETRVLPVISNEWYTYWYQIKPIALYLLYNNKINKASKLIETIESNIEKRGDAKAMDLLLYKLILAQKMGDLETQIEMESRLIGDSEEGWSKYSWAYVSRIKRLFDQNKPDQIVELLQIPLTKLSFSSAYRSSLGDQEIFRVLNKANCQKPLKMSESMAQTMRLGFIFYGLDCSLQL
ncbi:MAG: hypothetical protein KC646_12210 [Candidatus Cloacimonetes bacterium]|nr:hypothetical protein [Candidatus Cloacimonadota bacterium]